MFNGILSYRTTYEDIRSAYNGSVEAAFAEGNYAFAAQFGASDPELLACSLIMIGLPEKGLAIIAEHNLDTPRSRLYRAFALWCVDQNDNELESAEEMACSGSGTHQAFACSLRSVRRKGRINVLVMNKELELTKVKSNPDFNITTIGYSHQDDICITPGESSASITKKLNKLNFTPDFLLVFRPEFLLLFDGLQELTCPKIAFCTDYDMHIYQKYDDFCKFDKFIVYSSVDHFEISKIFKRNAYTHVLSTLLDTKPSKEVKQFNDRSFDVQITGSSFRTFFSDKSILLYELTQLEDEYNIRIQDGFLSPSEYRQALQDTKLVPTFVRFYGCFPTRGIEAIVEGAAILYPEGGIIEQFLCVGRDRIYPYRSGSIRDDVRNALKGAEATEKTVPRDKSFSSFEFDRAFLLFLKFCTFISLKADNSSINHKNSSTKPLSVVGNSWLHGGIGLGLTGREHVNNFLRIIDFNCSLKRTKQTCNAIASTYVYLWQTLEEGMISTTKRYRLRLLALAIETLEEAVNLFPDQIVLRFNLGRLCYHFGAKERAEEIFNSILESDGTLQLNYLEDDFWSPLFFFEEHFPYRAYIDSIIIAERNGLVFDEANSVILSGAAYYLAMLFEDRDNYEETINFAKKSLSFYCRNIPAKFLLSKVLMQHSLKDELLESGMTGALLFEESVREYSLYIHTGILDYVEVLRQHGCYEQIREAFKGWYRFFKRVRVQTEVLLVDRKFVQRIIKFNNLMPEEAAILFSQLTRFYEGCTIENNLILFEEIILKCTYEPGMVELLFDAVKKKRLVIKNHEIYRKMGIALIRQRKYYRAYQCISRYVNLLKSNLKTNRKVITHCYIEIGAEILKTIPFLYSLARNLKQNILRLKFSDYRLCFFTAFLLFNMFDIV